MRISQKVFAILLLGVVNATLSGATPMAPDPGHRPAGCHEHGQPVPSPAPVSHKCCEAGHRTAIVQETTPLRPSLAYVSFVADSPELLIAPHAFLRPSNLLISSSFEPLLCSLRI
jgi:hypothetical protein